MRSNTLDLTRSIHRRSRQPQRGELIMNRRTAFAARLVVLGIVSLAFTGWNFVSAAEVCSADNWCWRNPLPQGNSLFSVWGSGASDAWVVGLSGTILHWDGLGWTSVSSGTMESLYAVWGSEVSDVWAVGDAGTILHWDGNAWTNTLSGTMDYVRGVWGSGASDVWAVGYTGTIFHWDGSGWTSFPSGTTNHLFGVWGSAASDVWAVGGAGTLLHWDGGGWTSVGSGGTIFGVWGSG